MPHSKSSHTSASNTIGHYNTMNILDAQELGMKLSNLKKHKKMKRPSHTTDSSSHSEPRSRASPSMEIALPSLDTKDIFERSVQEQATLTSLSRRSSFNDQSIHSASPNLSLSPVNIPTHLSSEVFIPTCLDATTQVLTDNNANLEKLEVIQSNTPYITDVLNQTYNNSKSKRATSPLLKRRHTFNNFPSYPSTTNTNTNINTNTNTNANANSNHNPALSSPEIEIPMDTLERSNTTLSNYYVDYSDRKKLNFCSFADLLTEELLQKNNDQNDLLSLDADSSKPKTLPSDQAPSSPISRRNSRIYVAPAMIQTNAR